MNYRVKQFFWGLFARLTEQEVEFVKSFLEPSEQRLFFRLPRNEQLHSLKVAKEVIEVSRRNGLEDPFLIKAAFLHDIGKIDSGLNVFTKSMLVVLDKLAPGRLARLSRNKMVNAFYNHPEIAISYLEETDDRLIYYIRNHHKYEMNGDECLSIIQNADSKN